MRGCTPKPSKIPGSGITVPYESLSQLRYRSPHRGWAFAPLEEKTRNGILCTPSVNPPRKQRMSFRQRSVTYVKSFLRAFTREKRYPTCFKFRFVSSPLIGADVQHQGEADLFPGKGGEL